MRNVFLADFYNLEPHEQNPNIQARDITLDDLTSNPNLFDTVVRAFQQPDFTPEGIKHELTKFLEHSGANRMFLLESNGEIIGVVCYQIKLHSSPDRSQPRKQYRILISRYVLMVGYEKFGALAMIEHVEKELANNTRQIRVLVNTSNHLVGAALEYKGFTYYHGDIDDPEKKGHGVRQTQHRVYTPEEIAKVRSQN